MTRQIGHDFLEADLAVFDELLDAALPGDVLGRMSFEERRSEVARPWPRLVWKVSDLSPSPFIAVTDKAWFDFLSSRSDGDYLDEVNFWSPKSTRPMKQMDLGEPVFFDLNRL